MTTPMPEVTDAPCLAERLLEVALTEAETGVADVPGYLLAICNSEPMQVTAALLMLARLGAAAVNEVPELALKVLQGWRPELFEVVSP